APLAERDLLRPLDGFLSAVAVDQVEAAQRLLRLGERAVHDLTLSGLEADTARFAIRAQALAHDRLAGRAQLLAEAHVALHHGVHLGLRRRGCRLVVGADQQQVAHGTSSSIDVAAGGPVRRRRPLTYYDAGSLPKSTAGLRPRSGQEIGDRDRATRLGEKRDGRWPAQRRHVAVVPAVGGVRRRLGVAVNLYRVVDEVDDPVVLDTRTRYRLALYSRSIRYDVSATSTISMARDGCASR